jgi:hypothetical protein
MSKDVIAPVLRSLGVGGSCYLSDLSTVALAKGEAIPGLVTENSMLVSFPISALLDTKGPDEYYPTSVQGEQPKTKDQRPKTKENVFKHIGPWTLDLGLEPPIGGDLRP